MFFFGFMLFALFFVYSPPVYVISVSPVHDQNNTFYDMLIQMLFNTIVFLAILSIVNQSLTNANSF